jgi:hypothetical protein
VKCKFFDLKLRGRKLFFYHFLKRPKNRDSFKNAYQSQPFGAVRPHCAGSLATSEKARLAALFPSSPCMACGPDCNVLSLAASLVAVNKKQKH